MNSAMNTAQVFREEHGRAVAVLVPRAPASRLTGAASVEATGFADFEPPGARS